MGHIAANPMRGGARLWKPQAAEQPDPFTRSELSALLLAADVLDRRWGLMLAVWAATGSRSGEMRGLEAGDLVGEACGRPVIALSFDGALRVRRTYTKKRLGDPKNSRGFRTAPVPPDLLAHLEIPTNPATPLFGSFVRPGKKMEEAELYRLWNRTIAAAGVRRRVPENTRHTSISMRLSDGEPLLKVAQETGHSPAVMLRSYARWVPSEGPATVRNPGATRVGYASEMTTLLNSRSKFNVPLEVEAQGFCIIKLPPR